MVWVQGFGRSDIIESLNSSCIKNKINVKNTQNYRLDLFHSYIMHIEHILSVAGAILLDVTEVWFVVADIKEYWH